jgi:hypothetical protein
MQRLLLPGRLRKKARRSHWHKQRHIRPLLGAEPCSSAKVGTSFSGVPRSGTPETSRPTNCPRFPFATGN